MTGLILRIWKSWYIQPHSVGVGHATILTQASDAIPLALNFHVPYMKMNTAHLAALVSTSWMSTKNSNNTLWKVSCVCGCHCLLQISKVGIWPWRRAGKSLWPDKSFCSQAVRLTSVFAAVELVIPNSQTIYISSYREWFDNCDSSAWWNIEQYLTVTLEKTVLQHGGVKISRHSSFPSKLCWSSSRVHLPGTPSRTQPWLACSRTHFLHSSAQMSPYLTRLLWRTS